MDIFVWFIFDLIGMKFLFRYDQNPFFVLFLQMKTHAIFHSTTEITLFHLSLTRNFKNFECLGLLYFGMVFSKNLN